MTRIMEERNNMAKIMDGFSLDEFIEHVKVSGSLTKEEREYIDVRDVRLIIDTWLKQPKANNHELNELNE